MVTLQAALVALSLGQTAVGDAEDLLNAWEQGAETLYAYDVFVSAEQTTLLAPQNEWKPRDEPLRDASSSHQVLSHGKRRIESMVAAPDETPTSTVVWNGEFLKAYSSPVKSLILESELVHTMPDGIPQMDYEALYRTIGNLSVIQMIRQRPEKVLEPPDGSVFVLSTPPIAGEYNYSPFGFRVWLDSERNFMPVRIQQLLEVSGEVVVYQQTENVLEEVQPGVWAPVKSIVTGFPPILQSESPPLRSYVTEVAVDLDQSRFNPEVPEATFDLEVPAGTAVVDRIAGISYTYGAAHDAASHLSQLVLEGKVAVEELNAIGGADLRPGPRPGTERAARFSGNLDWLLWLNVSGLVVIAALVGYRAYRRRAA